MNDVQQDKPDADGLVRCFEQATPARQLPNLRGIPTASATAKEIRAILPLGSNGPVATGRER